MTKNPAWCHGYFPFEPALNDLRCGVWAGVDSVWEQKKPEARKMLEMPQNPTRPLVALLGV
jgi:hypothetical protein